MLRVYILIVVAGLAEIGGGYLVWLWLRNGKSVVNTCWSFGQCLS